MATVAANQMTFFEAVKLYGKDGKLLDNAEILQKKNGLHQDFTFIEGDSDDSHMSSVRASLPEVHDKVGNEGVLRSKATNTTVMEKPQKIEGWSVIEDDVAKRGGNVGDKKADQANAFQQSMIRRWTQRTLYGNPDTSGGKQIRGIMTRMSAKAGSEIGDNILLAKDAASGGDYTSILLIGHGKGKVAAWYPNGSTGGLEMEDFGREHVTVPDENGDLREVVQHSTRFTWGWGLAIDNPYNIVRIANVDLSDLAGGSPPDLILLMQQALSLIQDKDCRLAFYVSSTVEFWAMRQMYEAIGAAGGAFGMIDVAGGGKSLSFQGVPINKLEEISEAESRVQ